MKFEGCNLNLIACGVPRSGSTLVWQILQSLFPGKRIFTTHPAAVRRDADLSTEPWLVCAQRHPYDTIASRYRIRVINTLPHYIPEADATAWAELMFKPHEQNLKDRVLEAITKHRDYVAGHTGVVTSINAATKHINGLKALKTTYKKCIILKYEDFWNDFDVIFDAIEKNIGRIVTPEERKTLNEKFGMEANWKLSVFHRKQKSLVHARISPGHMGSIAPGLWQYTIPEGEQEFVRERCKQLCLDWDYPTEWPAKG